MNITSFNPFFGLNSGKLYHNVKKELLTPKELANRGVVVDGKYIGSLPVEWISEFREGDTGENTKRVFNILSDFAQSASNTPIVHSIICMQDNSKLYNNLRGRRRCLEPAYLWENNIFNLESALQKVFKDECRVQYIDDGSSGIVFKVSIGDKECALKTYYSEINENSISRSAPHGAKAEILNAAYLSDTLKASQCAKFYCAKFPSKGKTDGFMLSGFEDKPTGSKTAEEQRLSWFTKDEIYWGRFAFNDSHSDNFINGKLIDFGDIKPMFSTPGAREMAKEFFPMIKRGDVEGVLKFKKENEGKAAFYECMDVLQTYMGKWEDLESPEDFAFHAVSRKITRKMIDCFKALGADYSKIEECDFSLVDYDKYREKLEELFN